MPVTSQNITSRPYAVGNFNAPAFVDSLLPAVIVPAAVVPIVATRYRNEHIIYPMNLVRNDLDLNITLPSPHNALYRLVGAGNAGGDVIYLKYFDEMITSVRLPCPATHGVDLFVTDTLTGCKFFVDAIANSNDLMVYHANTHQFSAGAVADCDVQTAGADNVLDQLHNNAVANYARHGLVLNNVADCAKPVYYNAGGDAERRKRNQGRGQGQTFTAGQACFSGGCTIIGIPHGNTWRFYYQLYGTVDYSRPDIHLAKALFTFRWNYVHKKIWHGLEHAASYDEFKVVDTGRIY